VTLDHANLSATDVTRLGDYAESLHFGRRWVDNNIASVSFAARSDGFFLFLVAYKGELRDIDQLNLSCLVSSFLKEEMGHVHYYNKKLTFRFLDSNYNILHKSPIRVRMTEVSPVDGLSAWLAGFISDSMKLHGLMPEDGPDSLRKLGHMADSTRLPLGRPAFAVLRHQYDNLFGKTFRWLEEYKKPKITFGVILRRRASTSLAAFLCIVFGIAAYSDDPAFRADKVSFLALTTFGLFAAICWIALSQLVLKLLALVWDGVFPYFPKFFQDVGSFFSIAWRNLFRSVNPLQFLRDVYFISIVSGPFLFPLREVPVPSEVFKLVDTSLKIFWPNGSQLAKLDAIAQLDARVWGADFWLLTLEKTVILMPAFVLLIWWWEVQTWRKRIEKTLR